MYFFRTSRGPVELAFTDRHGGVSAAYFAPGDERLELEQVHGGLVAVADAGPYDERPATDAAVSARPGLVLMVRAADCVPVLLADSVRGVIGAAHCGRSGLVAGIVPNTVAAMRSLGATDLTAWVGPHICGGCYEVPADLQAQVGAVVPESVASTTWGTPSLDLGVGVTAQLQREGVTVVDVSTCTRESADLFSYRRDGTTARQAGLVRLRADAG